VQTAAISQARRGRASVIGTSRKSGGSGKNELSANEISAIAAIAWRCAAIASIRG
jgi:hypothetical protein